MMKRNLGFMMLILAGSLMAAAPAFADETVTDNEIQVIYAEENTEDKEETSEAALAAEEVSEQGSVSTAVIPYEREDAQGTEDGAAAAGSGDAEEAAAAEETQSATMGLQVARFALQFLGRPYVWGGTSLTNGADCSGFTMSVFRNFGISLPHSSASQRSVGTAVNGLENARPGDLICYNGHVSLYIGGGKVVHALNAKKGIVTSDASYKRILAIRRVI